MPDVFNEMFYFRISPREAEYLKKEFTLTITQDPAVHNDIEKWVQEKKQSKNATEDEKRFIEHYEDYKKRVNISRTDANNFKHTKNPNIPELEKKLGKDAVEYMQNCKDHGVDHYCNNIKDVAILMYEFLKLDDKEKEKMPGLFDYTKKRGSLTMDFLDFDAKKGHGVSGTEHYLSTLEPSHRRERQFDSMVYYYNTDNIVTCPTGYCIRVPKDDDIAEIYARDVLENNKMPDFVLALGDPIKDLRAAAKNNTIESEIAARRLDEAYSKYDLNDLKTKLTEVKDFYDGRPKEAWWHRKPAEDSAVRQAEIAFEGLIEALNQGTGGHNIELRLKEAKEKALAYLDEKDVQKGVDTTLSLDERFAQNGRRTAFGQGRYEAMLKIYKFCSEQHDKMLKDPAINRAKSDFDIAIHMEEAENKMWKPFDEKYYEYMPSVILNSREIDDLDKMDKVDKANVEAELDKLRAEKRDAWMLFKAKKEFDEQIAKIYQIKFDTKMNDWAKLEEADRLRFIDRKKNLIVNPGEDTINTIHDHETIIREKFVEANKDIDAQRLDFYRAAKEEALKLVSKSYGLFDHQIEALQTKTYAQIEEDYYKTMEKNIRFEAKHAQDISKLSRVNTNIVINELDHLNDMVDWRRAEMKNLPKRDGKEILNQAKNDQGKKKDLSDKAKERRNSISNGKENKPVVKKS